MKVLHILDHYKPHFSGYVFRTNYILNYQEKYGLDIAIVTSPKQGNVDSMTEGIDNLQVYRTTDTDFGNVPFLKELRLMRALGKVIDYAVKHERPDILHAHSPSLNALPALNVGARYNIPVVYEVRAFWEDAAVDHGTFTDKSIKYRVSRFVESKALKRADALFTICSGLKRDMMSRGIPEEKITVIQNCVDTNVFSPVEKDKAITEKYRLNGKIVIGFIGSLYQYEGLDLMIEAYRTILQHNSSIQLMIVGGGPEAERLRIMSEDYGLKSKIIFTGKVPHENIRQYYSVFDILVYPRKRMRLTELVTPLKPLEAMAMGKTVVGSNVGGIQELITDRQDGYLFPADDVDALSRLILELSTEKSTTKKISSHALEAVRNRHRWELAVKKYLPVYDRVTAKK